MKIVKAELNDLVGKSIAKIDGLEVYSDEVRIFTECGLEFLFHHYQDCCESVDVADFECEKDKLVGAVILSAELVTNEGEEGDENPPSDRCESWTWSFYKIETSKGEMWMRWLGESSGYYSELVDFSRVI